MKTLHLTLKKKWFDMIASGEKTEEYRDNKEYWTKRLMEARIDTDGQIKMMGKKFDEVWFRNGYQKYAPEVKFICSKIEFGEGKEEWGAEPKKKYFVIKLGYRVY